MKSTRRKRARHPRPLTLPRLPWRRLLGIAVAVALIGAFFYRRIDMGEVHAYADRLNAFAAFGLLTVLPLLGFPASVLHVAAGIRFGIALGLALVALSIFLQLLASYGLVHLFHDRFERWLTPLRKKIPHGTHTSICLLAVLLPGAPFAAINYVLPLIGVPLRTYLLCCLPLHVLRSTVTVTLGDQSDKFTPARLAVLGGYALLILGASVLTYRRLRAQLEGRPSAGDDRKQPA